MYSPISPSRINESHSTYKRYESGRIGVIGRGVTWLGSAYSLQESGLKNDIQPEVIQHQWTGKPGGLISLKSAGGFLIEEEVTS